MFKMACRHLSLPCTFGANKSMGGNPIQGVKHLREILAM